MMPSSWRKRAASISEGTRSASSHSSCGRGAHGETRVADRLGDREVRVGHSDVLADDADAQRLRRVVHPANDILPGREVDGVLLEIDVHDVAHDAVKTLVVHVERDVVDARSVDRGDDGVVGHVAEQGDLALESVGDGLVAATDDHVGLDAVRPQFRHRVLGGFRLLLTRGRQVWHQGEVHVANVSATRVATELADRLEERDDLHVAHGAADLHDGDVGAQGARVGADRSLISSVIWGMTWTVFPR